MQARRKFAKERCLKISCTAGFGRGRSRTNDISTSRFPEGKICFVGKKVYTRRDNIPPNSHRSEKENVLKVSKS